jgi:hypothetical protein
VESISGTRLPSSRPTPPPFTACLPAPALGAPAALTLRCRPAALPAGIKLFGVGFCASLLGVGITNSLMAVRQMLDPSFMPLNPPQVRCPPRLGWAGYLAGLVWGGLARPHIHPSCRRSHRLGP